MSNPKIGFKLEKICLKLETILPVRQVRDPDRHVRFKMILKTIKEVGMLEPLVVHPQKDGKYLLLDGHLRFHALKELGHEEADCIISIEDESFTYNARVSRLAPIQEHKMILKAVRNGVRPERIAAALNIPVSAVKKAMTLLDGIHEEAADLLKEKSIAPQAIRLLKKVTGIRQIEIAELMVSANNFTKGYAEALVLGTPKDELVNPEEPKQKEGLTAEQIARMEEEMETLERDLKGIEDTYAENTLNLTLARGYIKKLLENGKVVRFLSSNYNDILGEFESVAAAEGI